LEKTFPSSSTNDIEKKPTNEVFKEGKEVVILDDIFSVYKKHGFMFAPNKMKLILKIK
jgi:hypothetical protein